MLDCECAEFFQMILRPDFQLQCCWNEIFVMIILLITSIGSIALIINRDIVKSTIFLSLFSIILTISYLLLDAPDVAMTEAALGACLSTCVILNIIKATRAHAESITKDLSRPQQKHYKIKFYFSITLCLIIGLILIMFGIELPAELNNPEAPIHNNAARYYVENTSKDMGIPSVVAAVLASYRGFDTLGETTVILIAAISILFLTGKRTNRKKKYKYK